MSTALPKRNGTYLRQHQIEEANHEKERLTAQLSNPHVQDRPAVHRELRRIDRMLEHESPPDLTPHQKDVVAVEERNLRDAITADMLSQEEMRKAPPGAVGRLLAFERKHKQNILRWKNCVLALNKGNPNPDIANLERYRPATRPSDPSMHAAMIPGKTFSFPSEQFQQNFDQIDFTANRKEMAGMIAKAAQDPEIRQAMMEILTSPETQAESVDPSTTTTDDVPAASA